MPGKLQDYRITSHECLEAMLFSALRMVQEIGIETSRQDLLERAKGLAGISVNGNRIHMCADEAWSHVQLVFDVEYVHAAWDTQQSMTSTHRAEDAFHTLANAIRENLMVGEIEDTVLHLREYYSRSPLPRVFSSGQWNNKGRPDPLSDAEVYVQELIDKADYYPPEDEWRRLLAVYRRACRTFGTEPLHVD